MTSSCSRLIIVLFCVSTLTTPVVFASSVSSPFESEDIAPSLTAGPVRSNRLTLDDGGNIVYKLGEVLGENTFSATPSGSFVFSGDKYELTNDRGQIRVSTFQLKESSTTANKFELPGAGSKFEISTQGSGFSLIENGDVTAQTNLPLAVKKNSGSLWLVTPTGEKEIKISPLEALKRLVKEGVLTKVELIKKEVTFKENGQSVDVVKNDVQIAASASGAYYAIRGVRDARLLGIIPLTFMVNAKVDVESGRVIDSGSPWLLQNFGFLFSR